MPQKRKATLKKKSFFKKYNFEITVVTLIILGLFLIVEDFSRKYDFKTALNYRDSLYNCFQSFNFSIYRLN